MNSQVSVGGSPLTIIGNSRLRDAETRVPENKIVLNSTYAFGRWVADANKYVLGNRSSGINPYSFIAPNGASGRYIMGGLHWSF